MFALTPFRLRSADAYDPFRELENLQRRFFAKDGFSVFSVDIREEAERYLLEADLPGFSKEDIHIDIEGEYLTVKAERKTEGALADGEVKYLRNERPSGVFSRTFDLFDVDSDGLRASYQNGVLSLTMPKKRPLTSEKRQLTID